MSTKLLARKAPSDFYVPECTKKFKNNDSSAPFYTRLFTLIKSTPKTRDSIKQINEPNTLDHLWNKVEFLVNANRKRINHVQSKVVNFKKEIIQAFTRPYLKVDDFQKRFEAAAIFNKEPSVKPLTADEEQVVNKLFNKRQSGLASQFKKVTVDYKDIHRLYPETWLNDEVINFYFELLSDRATNNKDYPSIHCFNTFFCSTLREQGFAKVKRWTKRVDIFSKDLIFIPINQSYHWVLGVIDMKNKRVAVYDSLGGNHDHHLNLFLSYLEQEHLDKKKTPLDTSDWIKETPKDIPQQGNMSDCGAFTCTFAERLSLQLPFNFSQQDMTMIRRRMALNIFNKSI